MMRSNHLIFTHLVAAALWGIAAPADAQIQTTGEPGSPSATTTVDGRYIPNPPPAFAGEIGLTTADSKPGWPANIVPPKGAPNVLLIMTDDLGYSLAPDCQVLR